MMELGDYGEAYAGVIRNPPIDSDTALMGTDGLSVCRHVRCGAELGCRSGREAPVGIVDDCPHGVGSGENALGMEGTEFCAVVGSSAIASCVDVVRTKPCIHNHEMCNGDVPFNDGSLGRSIEGWVSPRISFSRDFVMVDMDLAVPHVTQSRSSRVSPEKRKWQQQDDGSFDFEFLHASPTREGTTELLNGFMLSADELFCNGKLLPLPMCNHPAPSHNFSMHSVSEQHAVQQQSSTFSVYKSSVSRPMARHLSFELSRPQHTTSHITFSCVSSPSRIPQGDSSPCSAPSLDSSSSSIPIAWKSSVLMPLTSATMLSSPSTKYSAKLKEMFKLKKGSTDEQSRDSSVTPACSLPISPRSFWPFARSSSICDNKAGTARRRILGTDASSMSSIPSHNADDKQDRKAGSSLMTEAFNVQDQLNEAKPGTNEATAVVEVSNAEASQPESKAHANGRSNNMDDLKKGDVLTVASSDGERVIPLDSLKKKPGAASGFARGSPGRRGGGTLQKNTGKIVLRNLERCSAEKRLGRDGWKGASRIRSSYCAATRVSPVLNVAIYRGGNTSRNGFFSFGSLFSSRKNKKPTEVAAINWRKGG